MTDKVQGNAQYSGQDTDQQPIPFFKPEIGDWELAAVTRVMRSGWLTSGPVVEEFERRFAAYVGAEYAVAVNSATAGLHVALEAMLGDRGAVRSKTGGINVSYVAVPSWTFSATAQVVKYVGCEPLFIDIDPATLNMDMNHLEMFLKADLHRIEAVIPVHIAGRPVNLKRLNELSQQYDFDIVQDAAHALPSLYYGQKIGAVGTAVFSFYANKTMTTGEGGMVVTDSLEIARKCKLLAHNGMVSTYDRQRHRGEYGNRLQYDVVDLGYKYNMSDLMAAIGIEQLRKVDSFYQSRLNVAYRYISELSGVDGLILPQWDTDTSKSSWHLFVVQLNPATCKVDRDYVASRLIQEGIGVSVHYKPLNEMTYWNRVGVGATPNAARVYPYALSLPIYPSLSVNEALRVTQTLKKILKEVPPDGC